MQAMAADRNQLMKEPVVNAAALDNVESAMNVRARQIARRKSPSAAYPYLDQDPEGVPLGAIVCDLQADPQFNELESDRNQRMRDPARNAAAIKNIEDSMNARAHERARKKSPATAYPFLDRDPEGVPLAALMDTLHDDPEFSRDDARRKELMADPSLNADPIQKLEAAMNIRAHEIAKEGYPSLRPRGRRVRRAVGAAHPFLHEEPYPGVPLTDILSDVACDADMQAMAADRNQLMKEPVVNAAALDNVESAMNVRARQIARRKSPSAAYPYLDQDPEGVPLGAIVCDLQADPQFNELESDRNQRMRDPARNAAAIKNIEDSMNARAHERARKKSPATAYPFLDRDPEGVPLAALMDTLHDDPEFSRDDARRKELMADPSLNADPIQKLEAAMNIRAHEIAKGAGVGIQYVSNPPKVDAVPVETPLERALRLKADALKRKACQSSHYSVHSPLAPALPATPVDNGGSLVVVPTEVKTDSHSHGLQSSSANSTKSTAANGACSPGCDEVDEDSEHACSRCGLVQKFIFDTGAYEETRIALEAPWLEEELVSVAKGKSNEDIVGDVCVAITRCIPLSTVSRGSDAFLPAIVTSAFAPILVGGAVPTRTESRRCVSIAVDALAAYLDVLAVIGNDAGVDGRSILGRMAPLLRHWGIQASRLGTLPPQTSRWGAGVVQHIAALSAFSRVGCTVPPMGLPLDCRMRTALLTVQAPSPKGRQLMYRSPSRHRDDATTTVLVSSRSPLRTTPSPMRGAEYTGSVPAGPRFGRRDLEAQPPSTAPASALRPQRHAFTARGPGFIANMLDDDLDIATANCFLPHKPPRRMPRQAYQ
eukprot:TRINITY_DN1569_c0_g1_i10.p1 TRINITY_DN1569_c0_g1~~TRINITY_DN1569_c0_g1_i10.p1  ORF type:complete len:828 (+),score=135.78 TRINITY_DN1569_c0_g1_i10:276-2759(+)